MTRYPGVGINIIRYLSERLAASEHEREIMAFRSVEQRLASKLLELRTDSATRGGRRLTSSMRG